MRKKINNFSDNVHRWLLIADLDYYTQFIKAWIPFNAWFNVSFHSPILNSDRKIIDYLKENTNPFRDRIINLVSGTNHDSVIFKQLLSQLHHEFEAHTIPSHDYKLSFDSINIYKNIITHSTDQFRNFHFKVTYNSNIPKSSSRVKCEIFDSSKAMLNVFLDEFVEWEPNNLPNSHRYQKLIETHKIRLKKCYEEVNPYKPISIIAKTIRNKNGKIIMPSNSILIDKQNNLYFQNDPVLISKVIIEILYQLRCCLFHGEINPTKTNQLIFEKSYIILRTLIQELK